jgi:protein-disulfide isomerase
MRSEKAASAVNSRRHFLRAAGAVLALTGFAAAATGAGAPLAELMAGEALPDVVLGKADAPVVIVEYASMTCTHCAAFHATAYPKLKSDYIDTGKVRFILREFPLDPLATAGFMLARCSGDDKRTAIVDLLFAQQKNWAFTEKPVEALASLLKQTGMSQESFEACLKKQDLYDNINKVRDRAAEKFQVNATPTFFINGEKFSGELTAESLSSKIDSLTKP